MEAQDQKVQQLRQALLAANMDTLWLLPETTANEPNTKEQAWLWAWNTFYPLLEQALEAVPVGSKAAFRRSLPLRNPGLTDRLATTQTLISGIQMLLPGEVGPVHRHTVRAARFIISGKGAYTVVDPYQYDMLPGDLVITPSMIYHTHGHTGSGPVIWFDTLDFPFLAANRVAFHDDHPQEGSLTFIDNSAEASSRFGSAAMLAPTHLPAEGDTPLVIYPWHTARPALEKLLATTCHDYEGALLEYINPATGTHVLPTMACYLRGLPAGFSTKARRRTCGSVQLVVEGQGETIINGKRFAWQKNDILAIPGWAWVEHRALGNQNVVLYEVNDLPMQKPFGFYREEQYTQNNGHQKIITP